MADISVISRLLAGVQRNISLSENALVVDNLKIRMGSGDAGHYATFSGTLTDIRVISMPDANVNLGDISTAKSSIDTHLNGEVNKHDASEIDYERADGSKKNIAAASDSVDLAIDNLDDAIGLIDTTPTNYSVTEGSEAIVAAHLAGIDSALATAGSKDFSDAEFRISDNTTATKKIAFEASAISADTVRTISMPDANVSLGDISTQGGKIDDLVTLSGVAANAENLGSFSGTVIADNQTIKQAIQALETYEENSRSLIENFDFLNSVKSFFNNSSALPADPEVGDRYIALATANGWTINRIYEWDGSAWDETIPLLGQFISADAITDRLFLYSGSVWNEKYFEATTASTGLYKDGFDIQLADASENASGIKVLDGAITLEDLGAFDTDDLSEGSTNKYFSASAAKTACVANSITDDITDVAPSQDAVYEALLLKASAADVADLVTLSGVAAGAENLGEFTGSTIADNQTIKAAIQALETAVESAASASVKIEKTLVAGEEFAANKSFLVRYAISGETAGRIYKADRNAGASGSETNTIYVQGLAQNRTGSAIAAGANIPVIFLGEATLQSSDSAFAAGEIGLPVMLGDAGAFDVRSQLTFETNDAEVWCATVKTTSVIEVKAAQIMGVN